MDQKRVKELAQDERWISGIYNYCDRWCERCPQTSRCLNYAMGEEESGDPETRDIRNEAFWKNLEGMFHVTIELLRERAAQEGIDLEELDLDEAEEQERLWRETAENYGICRAGKSYTDMAERWFDAAEPFFGPEEETGPARGPVGRDGKSPETSDLEDALEVVRWYQHQIYVKLMRAVHGLLKEDPEPADAIYQHAKDSDGSAKVALIGIDRSIAAWGIIRNQFPYHDREILAILAHLDRLRGKVEETFPRARGFLRPGFDEIPLNG
ncbi:MAG: hypothetical protein JXL84_18540 [Deltaproteobacteria bacterium]|nr:hypothetical protein [Deltaproteobacteria bacterium]